MFLLQMSFEVWKSGLQANLGTIYSIVDMAGIRSIPLNVPIAINFYASLTLSAYMCVAVLATCCYCRHYYTVILKILV